MSCACLLFSHLHTLIHLYILFSILTVFERHLLFGFLVEQV